MTIKSAIGYTISAGVAIWLYAYRSPLSLLIYTLLILAITAYLTHRGTLR